MHEIERLLSDMEGLLDVERKLLRNADFGGLPALSLQKERLISRIIDHPEAAPAERIQHVREKAQANLALFKAAKCGFRAAQERLDAIRRLASNLQTYDSSGRASAFALPVVRHERRV